MKQLVIRGPGSPMLAPATPLATQVTPYVRPPAPIRHAYGTAPPLQAQLPLDIFGRPMRAGSIPGLSTLLGPPAPRPADLAAQAQVRQNLSTANALGPSFHTRPAMQGAQQNYLNNPTSFQQFLTMLRGRAGNGRAMSVPIDHRSGRPMQVPIQSVRANPMNDLALMYPQYT